MMRKKILVLAILSLILLSAMVVSIHIVIQQNENKKQGKLVFAETYNQGHLVDKIELITANNKVVLEQDNSYWRVANDGDYFADFDLMYMLLSSINQSVYTVKLQVDEDFLNNKNLQDPSFNKEHTGMLIKTYTNDALLDEIVIGDKVDAGKYFYSRDPKSKNVWLIDGDFELPEKTEDWFLRSLVSIPHEIIESVTINDNELKRINSMSSFFDKQGKMVFIDTLLNVLQRVNIAKALSAEEFNAALFADKADIVEITTFYGLKFIFLFYSSDTDLWFEVRMDTTSLPMTAVYDFISENSFLYDGWYFKATAEQAFVFQHILRRF